MQWSVKRSGIEEGWSYGYQMLIVLWLMEGGLCRIEAEWLCSVESGGGGVAVLSLKSDRVLVVMATRTLVRGVCWS